MPTLVEQLQQEALNPRVSVSQLLRRVKLIAAKLDLSSTAAWVEQELNGYGAEVPEYRRISGQPRAFNPYNGWIPIHGNSQLLETISSRNVSQSMASLEALVDGRENDGVLFFPFSPRQMEILNRNMDVQLAQMGLHVDRSAVIAILDAVRSKVLDWAIELERQGISGSEVGFSPEEARKARGLTIHIGSFNGNFNAGDANGPNARVNLGSTDNSHNSVGEPAVFKDLLEAVARITDGVQSAAIASAVEDMRREAGRSGFVAAYQRFMAIASDHLGVVGPFLPALTALLGGS